MRLGDAARGDDTLLTSLGSVHQRRIEMGDDKDRITSFVFSAGSTGIRLGRQGIRTDAVAGDPGKPARDRSTHKARTSCQVAYEGA